MRKRDKTLIVLIVVAAVVVTLGIGVAHYGVVLREEWYIRKLDSASENTRLYAAERLAEMGSISADSTRE